MATDEDRTAQVAAIAAAWHRAFHGWKNSDDGVCPDDSSRAEALYDAGLRSGAPERYESESGHRLDPRCAALMPTDAACDCGRSGALPPAPPSLEELIRSARSTVKTAIGLAKSARPFDPWVVSMLEATRGRLDHIMEAVDAGREAGA